MREGRGDEKRASPAHARVIAFQRRPFDQINPVKRHPSIRVSSFEYFQRR